jgi:hypothetical protein
VVSARDAKIFFKREGDGKSVDTVLARELRDVMSAQSDWLAREIPGFAAELAWPH